MNGNPKDREREKMGINPLPRPAASASAELPRGGGFFQTKKHKTQACSKSRREERKEIRKSEKINQIPLTATAVWRILNRGLLEPVILKMSVSERKGGSLLRVCVFSSSPSSRFSYHRLPSFFYSS